MSLYRFGAQLLVSRSNMAKFILSLISLILLVLGVICLFYINVGAGVMLLAGFTFTGLILAASASDG